MAEMDVSTLEAAVAANPDDIGAWSALAATYYEQARFEAALDAFGEAARRQPGDVRLWLGMGRAAYQLQRAEVVQEAVAHAFDADPGHPELYRLICDAAQSPEQLSDRLVGAARYLQLSPDAEDHDAYVKLILDTLATVAEFEPWRAADVLESMPYLEAAVPAEQLAPLAEQLILARERAAETGEAAQDIDARLAGAWALLDAEPAEALAAFQGLASDIATLGDDRQPPLADLAATAYNGLAQAILACAPLDGPDRATHLELALEAAGEAEARAPHAEQPYREALAAELAALRSGIVGSSIYDYESDTPDAVASADLATEPLAPAVEVPAPPPPADGPRVVLAEAELLVLLDEAWAEADSGNLGDARVAFDTVLDRVDDRRIKARALAGLGRVELAEGARDAAMQRTEDALALDSGCGLAHLVRGLLAEGKSDWTRALQAYQFAEAAMPEDPRVLRGLGLALCERGDYAEAIAPLTGAHEARPDEPLIVVGLARCFVATAQFPLAVACLEAALAMDPDEELAAQIVHLLEQAREGAERPAKVATRPVAAAPTASAEPEEYDPDTAPPEATRDDDDDRPVRDRVLRRADRATGFDPETQVRCHVCRFPCDKEAERCERCGHSLAAPAPPVHGGGGRPCFVATAACGDAMAPEVVALRAYRDTVLCRTPRGRWLIQCYDRCSPPLARFIAERRWLAAVVRRRLIGPMAARLTVLGAER